MGSADDIEQGSNNLRNSPKVKHLIGSYQIRRRLSLYIAGIGIAFIIAAVTFASYHMNGKPSNCHLCWSKDKSQYTVDFR
jgi:hypothetical protein